MVVESLSLVVFAFGAGMATFFAPCAAPLLPGYVAFYVGRSGADEQAVTAADGPGRATSLPGRLGRAAIVGLLVSAGVFAVYLLLAGVVGALGARLLGNVAVLELVVGAVFVAVGTGMALDRHLPTPTVQLPRRRRSASGYVAFGALYAVAAAGCTAPIFIAVAVRALTAGPELGFLAFGAYAAGTSVLAVGVTVATALGRDTLLRRVTGSVDRVYRVAGVLLVVAGVVQILYYLVVFDGLRTLGLA